MPLGDSILVFQLYGERSFKPFSEKDDQIQAVYLPLSSKLVLVGSADDATPDLLPLPLEIARCSLEYFISHSKSNGNDALHERIAENSHLLSEEQIDTLIAEVIRE